MTPTRVVLAALGLLLVAVAVGLGVLGQEEDSDAPAAAVADGPLEVAGLRYSVQASRPLDERADAAVIGALPAGQRRATRRRLLYGVFVSVANTGARPAPTARRFALVDADDRAYAPLSLRPTAAFAYRPQTLRPGAQLPPTDSAAARDLPDQGFALVFRIPRYVQRLDDLSLRVSDPTGAAPPADLPVQD